MALTKVTGGILSQPIDLGITTATTGFFSGIVTAQSVRVLGDLTVDGSTTTLDTVVTEVDRLEVAANNVTVGVAITQSGTGDILKLYDSSTPVFVVKDGGRVGIGTDNPTAELDIEGASARIHLHDFDSNQSQIIQNGDSLYLNVDSEGNGSGSLRIRVGGNDATAEKLRINSAGSVGIKTNAPGADLHIYDGVPEIRLQDSDGTNQFSQWKQVGGNTRLQLRNGNSNGSFIIQGFGGGTSTDPFVRVGTDGSVGIGTDSIESGVKLHIQDTKHQIRLTHIGSGSTFTDAGVIFKTNDSQLGGVFTEVDGEILSYGINVAQLESGINTSRVGGIFRLDTRTGGFGNGSCFVVKGRSIGTTVEYNSVVINLNDGNTFLSPSKGSVGINSTTPTSKLDVVGDVKITGIMTAVSFVGDGSGLTGVASTDNIITGTASTFTGGVDINSNLDVDGRSELDIVNIAETLNVVGISTFSGNVNIGGALITNPTGNSLDFSGSITASDVVTAGALLHEGDTDTLVHFSAADTIDFKTFSIARLTVNNSGVSLRNNATFNTNGGRIILGDSTGGTNDDRIVLGNDNDCFLYHDSVNSYIENNTGILKILGNTIQLGDGTDKVGINTTVAQTTLEVVGAGVSVFNDTKTSAVDISGAGKIELVRSDSVAYIDFKTSFLEDFDCRIQQFGNGLRFYTGGQNSAGERLRILSDGKVGIGTDTATAKLEITDAIGLTNEEVLLKLQGRATKNVYFDINADANRRGVIRFKSAGTDKWSIGRGDSDELSDSSFFIANGSSGGNTAKFVITSAGSVGIKSSTPNTRLDVIASYAGRNWTPSGSVVSMFERIGNSFITLVGGTTSVVGIDFADSTDNNRGFIHYDHNDDSMFFRTNSAEQLRITSTGNVGIGTSVPTQLIDVYKTSNDAQIKVRTTANGAYFEADSGISEYYGLKLSSGGTQKWFLGSYGSANFQIKNGTAASDAERFTIQNNTGHIGINSTIPEKQLVVRTGSGSDGGILVKPNVSFANNQDRAYLIVGTDDWGTGSSWKLYGFQHRIKSNSTGTARVTIDTTGGEAFCVENGGNVGIGTNNPGHNFHLQKDNPTLALESNATTGNTNIVFGDSASSTQGKIQYHNNGDYMRFFTNGDHERLRITSDGDVGIGTVTPDHNLHVYQEAGDAAITIESTGNGNHSALEFMRTSSGGDSKGAGSIYVTGDTSVSEAKMQFGVGHNIGYGQFPRMTIMGTDGNVGIGTDDPTQKLEVKYGEAWIDNNSGDSIARSDGLTVSHTPNANFTVASDPTDARRTATFAVKGASRASVVTLRNIDDDSAFWDFIADGNTNKFYIQRGGGGGAALGPAVSIDTNLNVGIGTASPGAVLHVEKNGTSQVLARFESNMGTNNSRALSLTSPASDSGALPFTFSTGNSISFKCDTHVVHIDTEGRLGVGIDNPQHQLHIDGDIKNNEHAGIGSLTVAGVSTFNGTAVISAGAFSANLSAGGRNIAANIDIRSVSARTGIVVRNVYDYRSDSNSLGGFQVWDPYDSAATSYAFIAAEGATLVDKAWIKTNGTAYFAGLVSFAGDVSIGGTLTYEDVTNIDSVGLITARSGLHVTSGVSTFAGLLNCDGGFSSGLVQIGVSGIHRIDTSSGNLTVASSGGKIELNGLVGVGTDLPDEKLHVVIGSSTPIAAKFERSHNNNVAIEYRNTTGNMYAGLAGNALGWGIDDDSNIGSEPMFIVRRTTGYVGIGTAAPDEVLHVLQRSTSAAEFKLENNEGYLLLRTDNNVATYGAQQHLFHNRANSKEYLRITSTGDILTGGLTSRSFENDSSNQLILEVTGGGSGGNYGMINVSGNSDSSNTPIGRINFINRENSASTSTAVAGSKALGYIDVYTVTSDSNAGDDSGGYMRFATKPESGGSAERMRITSDGKFSLGTINASPNAGVHIDIDSNNLLMLDNATASTQKMFFAQNGGTHAQIYATSAQGALTIESDPSNNHNNSFINFKVDDNEALRITSDGRLQIGSSTLTNYNEFSGPGRLNIQNNSADGTVDFSQGIVFTDNVTNQGTWTHAGIVATGSSGYNGNLVFGTDGSGSRDTSGITEKMRITNDGKVGIGTNNPVTKLHVESTTGTTTYATISQQKTYGSGTGTAERAGLNLAIREVNQAANNRIFGRIEVGTNSETDSSNGFMSFFTRQSGGISEKVRITSDGNVGIGTDDPQGKLHLSSGTSGDCVLILESDTDNSEEHDNPYIEFRQDGGIAESVIGMDPYNLDSDNNSLVLANSVANNNGIIFKTGTTNGYTNATEKLRIESNGNIKAKSATQYKGFTLVKADGGTVAQLVGHGSDNDEGGLNLWDGGTKKVQILSNGSSYLNGGNIGIGTNAAGTTLDVFGFLQVKDSTGKLSMQMDGANGNFKVFQSPPSWTNLTYNPNPILAWDFKSGPGDMMYMGSGGNTPTATQMALVISDNHGFKVGRSGYDGTDFDVSPTAEYFRVTNTGLVGVGTNSPQTKLHVRQATDDNTDGFRISRSNSNASYSQYIDTSSRFNIGYSNPSTADPSPQITLDQNGQVGIGTASPNTKLDVTEGSILVDAFNTPGDHGIFFRRGFKTGANPYNVSILAVDHSGANKDGLSINAYDGISFCTGSNTRNEQARITQAGRVGIGTNNPFAPLDVYEPDGTIVDIFSVRSRTGAFTVQCSDATAANPTWALRTFATEDLVLSPGGNADVNEKVRIKANTGKVGIGTNNPGELLDVYKTSNDAVIKVRTTSAGAYFVADSPASSGYYGLALSSSGTDRWFVGSYNSNNFQIKDGSGASGTATFTIQDSTGNIGIGSVIPSEKLDVAGHIKVDGGPVLENASSGDILKITSPTGYVEVGSKNSSYVHFTTDRSRYYFNKKIIVDEGLVASYNEDLVLATDVSEERIRIKNDDGHVGIGTNNPLALLALYSDANDVALLHFDMGSPADRRGWSFKQSLTGTTTRLNLQAAANGKSFVVSNANDTEQFEVHTSTTGPFVRVQRKLHVDNDSSPSTEGGILVQNVLYSSNQDFPYLIIGTQNWTGATTNWGTYGFQHRIKSDGGGVPRITIDNPNGEIICFTSGKKVGIGVTNPTHLLQVNGSFAATTKSFVIDHPTKEGMKLRHGSLEGPENGVYVRGRLKDNNKIELPDYWTGLVDEDTITVNLTPIGSESTLHKVVDIYDNTVIVNSEDGNINCFYTVFGERKDVEKMEVEY